MYAVAIATGIGHPAQSLGYRDSQNVVYVIAIATGIGHRNV